MIKIDENNNKVVTYDNDPDVERQLFPNIPLTVDISPLQDEIDALDERVGAAEDDISSIQTTLQTFNGQPVVVDSVEDMTDQNIIYVYVGDEAGYTSGDWYYYDGEAWVSGGEYVANPVVVDDTLTQAGEAADAKAVGDELTQIKSDFSALDKSFNGLENGVIDLIPTHVFNNTRLYAGFIEPSNGSILYCYDLTAMHEYTVVISNKDFCVYGLSNNLYDGNRYQPGVVTNKQVNHDTFINNYSSGVGYKYLYITKNDGGSDNRDISVSVTLSSALGDKYENTLEVASNHLRLIADKNVNYASGYIKSTDGAVVASSSFRSIYMLNVSGAKKIVLLMPVLTSSVSKAGIAFYDSNEDYISGVMCNDNASGGSEIRIVDVPNTAVYMRTCCRAEAWDDFFIKIDDVYVNQKAIESLIPTAEASSYGMQMFEKIGVISDSVSVGWAKDKNGNSSRRNTGISWVQQMARRLGCTAYDLGASGVDPIEWFQSNYEFAEYCYTQYQSVGACDLYIIGLGLNQGTIGSISDIDENDYTQNGATFYGQYARIVQMINHDHPDALVMCLTEPSAKISDYDQAVRNICALEFLQCELVDLDADYIGLFTTPEILAERYSDGYHFTPYGYSLIAEAMMTSLNDYISKNTDAFKYVGVAEVE